MQIELVWKLIKNLKAEHIHFATGIEMIAGSLGDLADENPFLICHLNGDKHSDEYEQIFSLLHEALHDYPDFRNKSNFVCNDPKIESAIDEMTKKIFREHLEIFQYLQSLIREAKVLEIRKSVLNPSEEIQGIDLEELIKECASHAPQKV